MRRLFSLRTAMTLHLDERGTESAAVQKAGQGVFQSQSSDVSFGLRAFGDIRISLDKATVRQISIADFKNGSIRRSPFADRMVLRRKCPVDGSPANWLVPRQCRATTIFDIRLVDRTAVEFQCARQAI